MEETFLDVETSLRGSKNRFLEEAFLFSTLKTQGSNCFDADSFTPLDEDEVLLFIYFESFFLLLNSPSPSPGLGRNPWLRSANNS